MKSDFRLLRSMYQCSISQQSQLTEAMNWHGKMDSDTTVSKKFLQPSELITLQIIIYKSRVSCVLYVIKKLWNSGVIGVAAVRSWRKFFETPAPFFKITSELSTK